MDMMLGKRKREVAVVSRETKRSVSASPPPAPVDAQELLRKYFESRFEPIEEPTPTKEPGAEDSSAPATEDEDGSDWDGISDDDEDEDDDTEEPEVVDHTISNRDTLEDDEIDKLSRKEFMSAKPPSAAKPASKSKSKSKDKDADDDDGADAANLQNDLALQRLLKESHLLESADDLNPTGKNRHRAQDMRMQSLGSKTSLFNQKSMPMSHRKGISAKVEYKDTKRRHEARENGVILEKPAPKKSKNVHRERGIGGPGVGKFAGGTLTLSKSDVMAIQGPRTSSRGRGGGRGRGRGRGGGQRGRG